MVIVVADGAGVEHAGGVAFFRTTEVDEKVAITLGLGIQLVEQCGEIDTDFKRAVITGAGERNLADVILTFIPEKRPAVEDLRGEFVFGLGGVFVASDADGHPQVRALVAGELQF